jgi:pimeloyl-ACP methyl ester carboxylesterase
LLWASDVIAVMWWMPSSRMVARATISALACFRGVTTREHTIPGPGGRTLHVLDVGDPGDVPVVVHHGTPGSRHFYERWLEDAAARGIRLIGYDRPGYGGSDRHAGRTVADAAADVEAICDGLGLDRVLTHGGSGGGPHALACAALLGDRVAAAATLCSVGPFDADGLDFVAGMGESNVVELGAAVEGAQKLAPLLEEFTKEILSTDPQELAGELASILSPPDVAVVNGGLAEELLAGIREGIAESRVGWLDDDLAFVRPWGFDLSAISVPMLLWQGRQDLMVPPAHGEWLAEHVPGVEAHLSDEDGHLSVELRRIGDVHAWLLEPY